MTTLVENRDGLAALRNAVGEALITDADALRFAGQDVFSVGETPVAILRPGDVDTLARGIAAAAAQGLAVVPRGGGMSYSSGYLPEQAGVVVVDMSDLNRIVEVNETDMTVTVEAGCTWEALYRELHPRGLRTPLWGTLSGTKAQIGGGVSQNGTFWGASRGSISASVLSLDVVLADGSVMRTGHTGFRPYGPDVTGLFGGDCGAFGIKARVTLPLIAEARAFAYGSFAFAEADAFFAACSAIARAGLATECFGFDPFLQAQRMKRDSLAKDAKSLVGMMKSQGGFWKGLKEGAKVVAAGRSFLDDAGFSAHVVCEGRNQPAADADLAEIRAIVARVGGREVENTIPKIMRANPFPPVNSMLGPSGERWVPVHAVVRHGRALHTLNAVVALYADHADAMEAHSIGAGYLFMTVGTTGFLIEPVFFWPDAMTEIHERSVEASHLAKLTRFPANAEARAVVEHLRAELKRVFAEQDAAHFQIGRSYPLESRSDPRAWQVVQAVKRTIDPDGRMNPGVLGL